MTEGNIEKQKLRCEELVRILNDASKAYYGGLEEKMSNYEWDALFDELSALEAETGYILPDSPTQTTGAQEKGLNREAHEFPALSLAKTKRVADLQKWAGDKEVWLSWKLDGLTLVLTYDNGTLSRIVTRGNGTVGSNITYLKHALHGFPLTVSYQGHLVVRGEAVISYTDFEMINDTIEDDDEKYANPRNLASGTLSLDDSDKVAARCVTFHAFTLVYTDEAITSFGERMNFLRKEGFTVVESEHLFADQIPGAVDRWTRRVERGDMDLPVDGLVICYEDTVYAAGGSVTGHHATRAGFAFKWQDVSAMSPLRHVEWSCAASTISPVAVFEPVQLEGTTVSRASLCNISEMERLGIAEHCTLEIIKANKIIPKCISVSDREGTFAIPKECPVCHASTEIRISKMSGTKTLHCTNPNCSAKHLKKFARFVSKSGMDMDGLSIQTMLKFMNEGFISKFSDLYHLSDYADRIRQMEGFGDKSCDNMLNAIEKSRHVNPVNLIYALCIPMLGLDAGKKIVTAVGFQGFLQRMEDGTGFEDIEGIGPEKSGSVMEWFAQPTNRDMLQELLREIEPEEVTASNQENGRCRGLTFVITGDVHHFKNRDAFRTYVEAEGGKVTGSVSKKTDYLVNNDVTSTSAKNQKARELQIPILSEEDFISQFGSGDQWEE